MVTPDGRTRIVVTDATVLINLIHVDRLAMLGSLSGYEFVVPPEVEAEVCMPAQADMLAQAFRDGYITRSSFTGTPELELYVDYVQEVGKGEAACLAMAAIQGWYVASDEQGRFLRLAKERLGPGRIVNTAGIYVLAIRTGLLSIEHADKDKQTLESHRFKMRFSSFRDVVEATGSGIRSRT
jgi:predicted nucleic acid-binding protein